jgi:DNA modification methylase
MPEELACICILAGSRSGDTVLDPFCGSGTTGAVALGNGRGFVGIDINRKYLDLAVARIGPMLTTVEDVGPGRTPADAQPETKEADGG